MSIAFTLHAFRNFKEGYIKDISAVEHKWRRELMTRYTKNQMRYVNLKIFLWLRDV